MTSAALNLKKYRLKPSPVNLLLLFLHGWRVQEVAPYQRETKGLPPFIRFLDTCKPNVRSISWPVGRFWQLTLKQRPTRPQDMPSKSETIFNPIIKTPFVKINVYSRSLSSQCAPNMLLLIAGVLKRAKHISTK